MDWDDLRYFLAAANADSLSQAAKKLGVNQTTVSRRLSSLQEQLGVRLLDRTTLGVETTPAGEDALKAATQVEEILTTLGRRLAGHDSKLTGQLRVTTLDLIPVFEMALFDSFLQQFPDIELEISVDNATRNLSKREADVAIRWTNKPLEQLIGRKLTTAEFALYAAPKLIAKQADNTNVAGYPWLGWEEIMDASATNYWMKNHVPKANIICRFNNSLAMFNAIKSGMGIAFLPCAFADPDPGLQRIRQVESGFGMDIWVLTHPDLRTTAKVKAFMQHTVNFFSKHHSRYLGNC